MKLFDILPDRFFSLLTSKNKAIYAEAILLLYDHYQKNRFGIPYLLMRDVIQELIETQSDLGVLYEEEEEESKPSLTLREIDTNQENLFREKANILLRRLKTDKWIDVEDRENFQQFIVLPQYTIRILSVFKELCQQRTVEYQRYAFLTYQLLSSEEMKERPSLSILEAKKHTEEFLEELRILVNNMKNHMEQVVIKETIQEVLDHHFDEYKAKIVDRSYHRLKTSDHVSRYRMKILEVIRQLIISDELLQEAVEDGVKNEFFTDKNEAEEKLIEALQFIEEVYHHLDELYYQVDVRHNQYLRASYDRARYLTQHQHGVENQLAYIIEAISKQGTVHAKKSALSSMFRLMERNNLTNASLYTPRKRRPPHQPEPHTIVEVSEEIKEKAREYQRKRIGRAISREKVNSFVMNKLQDREQMEVSELVPSSLEEYLYLPYVYLYGYDQKADYVIERSDDQQIIQIGDYRFHQRTIIPNTNKKGRALR